MIQVFFVCQCLDVAVPNTIRVHFEANELCPNLERTKSEELFLLDGGIPHQSEASNGPPRDPGVATPADRGLGHRRVNTSWLVSDLR